MNLVVIYSKIMLSKNRISLFSNFKVIKMIRRNSSIEEKLMINFKFSVWEGKEYFRLK